MTEQQTRKEKTTPREWMAHATRVHQILCSLGKELADIGNPEEAIEIILSEVVDSMVANTHLERLELINASIFASFKGSKDGLSSN